MIQLTARGDQPPPTNGQTTALLIRNPVARHALSGPDLARALAVAREAGWHIECVETDACGHATELARAAASRGIDVVIVHGGDGTINEAANGLAGTQTALAGMRGGTANIWVKEIRLPKGPEQAMRAIVSGERRRVDLGRAGGRYFLLMCGLGIDAAIVPRVSARLKRRIGALAYIIAGVSVALRTRPWPVRMTVDETGSETPLYFAVIGNTRSYGGVVNIAHRALVDDAALDLVLMRRGGVLRLLRDSLLLLLRRHDHSPNVRYTRARTIEIATPGVPVQLDGEAHGATPMRFEVAPLALTVIVPRGLRSPLFGNTRDLTDHAG